VQKVIVAPDQANDTHNR